jgi:H+/Cl- antiporter ClcA
MLMKKEKTKVLKMLSSLNGIKWNVAFKGLISGIIAGLFVVAYRLGIEYGGKTASAVYSYLRINPIMILPWVIVIVAAGLFIAWLVKLEPMATGSGIPQVEGLLLYGLKIKWYSVLIVRFLGGILASFFGLSLGREGPSIQIGASGSQAAAKMLSRSKLEENCLITGGAAAGLSAAFNAPLSGIVFALEEIHRSFSPIVLIAATTAALTADVVSKFFLGLKPVLAFTSIPPLPFSLYLLLIPLGLFSGLIGSAANKALLWFQSLYGRLPPMIRPSIALLIALPCGLFLPQVLGGGQELIGLAESYESGFVFFLVLLSVKLLFTCTSFGSGIPGGIFMPILSVGALSGSIFAAVATYWGMPAEYVPSFAVCAMAGALSAAVKAPVTSILLAAEMTGSLVHLMPVAACAFIAMLLSDFLKVSPIYEALLERIVGNGEKVKTSTKIGGLLEVPVEFGSFAAGRTISEISWPSGTLIVRIQRGDKEIVPRGNVCIMPGDYLIVLSSEQTYKDNNLCIRKICNVEPDMEENGS